jgi:hypothetical protein
MELRLMTNFFRDSGVRTVADLLCIFAPFMRVLKCKFRTNATRVDVRNSRRLSKAKPQE